MLNKTEEDVACLIIMIYKLNERSDINDEEFNEESSLRISVAKFSRSGINDEKSNEESSLRVSIETFVEKFNEESIKVFPAEKLLRQIREIYKHNDVV